MSNALLVVVLAVVFTAVLSVVQALYWAYVAKQEREQAELQRRLGNLSGEGAGESLFREQAKDAVATALGNFGDHLQELIVQADLEYGVSQLLARSAVLAFVGALLGGIFFGLLGSGVGLVAGVIPYLWVRKAAGDRQKKLVEQLPDTLELMARSLQAGLGLSDAMRLVAEEMPLPAAAEFGRVFEEIRFGRDYRESFGKMLERNPGVFDLRLMVSSILLQRETGGNLIEILESISGTIRSRFLFQAKVKAMASEARFSALILGALPMVVGTVISLNNPTYLAPLFEDPLGNMFLLYAFSSYSIGAFIMRDVSQVEV